MAIYQARNFGAPGQPLPLHILQTITKCSFPCSNWLLYHKCLYIHTKNGLINDASPPLPRHIRKSFKPNVDQDVIALFQRIIHKHVYNNCKQNIKQPKPVIKINRIQGYVINYNHCYISTERHWLNLYGMSGGC